MEQISKIYETYYKGIKNIMFKYVKDFDEAEDLANDIIEKFCKLYAENSLNSVIYDSNNSNFSNLLFTFSKNKAIDYLRTKKCRKTRNISSFVNKDGDDYLPIEAPKNLNSDSLILCKEMNSKIATAFRKLSPNYRKVAILVFLRGCEYEEIAKTLNIPINSVKVMIYRSREKLQKELKGLYYVRSKKVIV